MRCALAFAVFACMLVVASCSSSILPESSEFVVRVDSISGPTAVSGGIAFESRLWGVVGGSGCYSFKELRTVRVANQIDVTVVGQYAPHAVCTQAFVTLDGVILRVEPVIPTQFFIVVHQPDGTTLSRRIYGE